MEKTKNILKVPNGKLLKIFLEYENDKIASVKITGDFYVYPEESIELLEKDLADNTLEKSSLLKTIEGFIKEHEVEFFGVTADALADAIMGAVK